MDSSEGNVTQHNFSELLLPDSTVVFSNVFQNISELNGSIESPPCYINNLPWRILLMSNSQPKSVISSLTHQVDKGNLAIYLQCNPDNVAPNWSCYATADISVMPMRIDKEPLTKSIKHLFSPKENDWGFRIFENLKFLLDPENGYVLNDSIAIQMHVNSEIPHGIFWDSKKHTGYVGLTNQGATCYMNSLLQTIFFTNELRRAIYCMPTEADDARKSVAFALQRVFYDLQNSEKPVGTKRLTNSFGWDTMDSFMQHDVQEFLRVLLTKIETKMKGTSLEGIVPKLFAGKMCSYIRCKNVNYNSSREETFYDIQLSIKGKKNIYESFQDYIAPEILNGENKYFAGEHGLQEAEKGVIFKSLPPVLHLHLMRFQYDSWNDVCIKFNDRFEFYETIDLTNFLDSSPSDNENNSNELAKYKLHAVLVHSGDNHGGHYVVYINIDIKGKWYKFDDDVVTISTTTEAIEQNFGGIDEENKNNIKTCTNAYMLSYIQISEIPNILKEINENDINAEFIEHLNEMKRFENVGRSIKCNQNIISVNIILEDNFDIEDMQNFFNSIKISYITFYIDIMRTLNEFLDIISYSFKISRNNFRLWPLLIVHDYIKPSYLDCNDYEQNLNRTLQSIKELRSPWYILLQFSNPLNLYQIQNFDSKQQVLLIYKLFQYDAKNKVNFLSMSYRNYQDAILDVVNEMKIILKDKCDITNCEFNVYEEISGVLLDSMDTLDKSFKFKKNETNSATLVFEKYKTDDTGSNRSYQDFILDQHSQIEISFINKSAITKGPTFCIQLAENITLEQMALEVAKRINTDINKVQFFKTSCADLPLRMNALPVKDIFRTRCGAKLFYQILSMDVTQLQNKLKFPVIYLAPNLRDEKELILYIDKTGLVSDVLNAARIELKTSENDVKYRLIEIENNYIKRWYRDNIKLSDLDQFYDCANQQATVTGIYRIEDISKTEALRQNIDPILRDTAGGSDDYVSIPVMHFNKTMRNSFGTPFFVVVRSELTFEQLFEQIRKKLCIPEIKWSSKYKMCLVTLQSPCTVSYLNEDNLKQPVPLKHFCENSDGSFIFHIGLDHASKLHKKSKDLLEKSLKIYN